MSVGFGPRIVPSGHFWLTLGVPKASLLGFFVLAVISWAYVLAGDDGFAELARRATWTNVLGFLRDLAGMGLEQTPAFLDGASWAHALRLSVDTLAMSVLAIGLAGIGVSTTFLPAARNVANGELGGGQNYLTRFAFYSLRTTFIFTRAVPELVWALLIVFILSPGILPGALALAIHNYGILGKLSAEVVENIDPRPARALRSAGAGKSQMLLYGILPQVLSQFLTYLLYRWEVIIRTTIVVGFVAAGGLGQEFRLRMSWFHYDYVTLLLLCYLMLVVSVDLIAAGLRRLAR